jgi:hypothetical protein
MSRESRWSSPSARLTSSDRRQTDQEAKNMKLLLFLMLCTLRLQAQEDPRYIKPLAQQDEDQVRWNHLVQALRDDADANREKAAANVTMICFIAAALWLVLVVAGCACVANDSRKNRVPCIGNEYNKEKDPKVWAIICFLFFPVFFYYAYCRAKILGKRNLYHMLGKRDRAASPQESEEYTDADDSELEALESQLQALKLLMEKGLITDAEMHEKRRKILGL